MAVRTVPPSEMTMLAEFWGQPGWFCQTLRGHSEAIRAMTLEGVEWNRRISLPVPPYATDLMLAYAGAADVVLLTRKSGAGRAAARAGRANKKDFMMEMMIVGTDRLSSSNAGWPHYLYPADSLPSGDNNNTAKNLPSRSL